MSDNNVTDMLKDALTKAYDQGYAKGRVDALKALSTSMHFVYGIKGVVSEDGKKGYMIALQTIDGTLKILEQNNEESGF